MIGDLIKKFIPSKHERELKRLQPMVDAIGALEPKIKKLSDAELQAKTAEFRQKLDNGASLDDILLESFAVTREAGWRALGMRHYDVQLIGGIVLHQGRIAEMKTGEGKTLVATLPVVLNALEGKGVHLVTVNDYLAQRDAEWMSKLYSFLGLTTGVVHSRQPQASKMHAYRCDITYGQNNEFGFDYMRDNMKFSIYDYAQRDLNFAIIDEVDSILIDEARTPLIISGPGDTASEKYQKINELIPRLRRDEHYELDEKANSVTLTEEGIIDSQRMLLQAGITKVENLYDPVNLQTLHILQQCLRAHALYRRDKDYMVTPSGEVLIIDEFTGRTLPGRRWSDGLHQAIEAKEHVSIQDENITLATISFQNLFRLYKKLSGMTGTADTEAAEFHKIYDLEVNVIPTNKPIARIDAEDLVYKSERGKFKAIADEITECNKRGAPVLVGTTSVEKSEALYNVLTKRGIDVSVLNAKQHEREAFVVAQAGRKGAVTVATNMAGRGTDILLGGNPEMIARGEILQRAAQGEFRKAAGEGPYREGEGEGDPAGPIDHEALEAAVSALAEEYVERCKREKQEVLAAGGLHIIGTERHESRRVDNQLRGRAGRQGDPGHSRFYLSLEDDLMRIFAGERVQTMMDRMGMEEDVPIEHKWVSKSVENAQKKVEERNFDIRKNLLDYDDVMNQQRKSIYTLRKQVLTGEYRTVPTEEQQKQGAEPQPIVTDIEKALQVRAEPILLDMLRHHAAPLIPKDADDATRAALEAERAAYAEKKPAELGSFRAPYMERDVYMWFGCRVDLSKLADDPAAAYALLCGEVGLSLTEQKERLLDLTDEIVGTMVARACPAGKQHDDWDLEGLRTAFREQFGIQASGLEKLSDASDVAAKLYADAEAVLLKKLEDFGAEAYLRLFRNIFMQEIDRQWMDHLQNMGHLRDGIGLRGYGQRDPKREYKREGYDLFQRMMDSIKSSVGQALFAAERVTEEELQEAEEQRQRETNERQRAMDASARAQSDDRTAAARGGARRASGAPGAGGPASLNRRQRRRVAAQHGEEALQGAESADESQTVRRERPKVGRNDPCYCGSGKKYKNCHFREDRAAASRS